MSESVIGTSHRFMQSVWNMDIDMVHICVSDISQQAVIALASFGFGHTDMLHM